MSYTYKDLQDRVKENGTRSEGGTTFNDQVNAAVNSSLFRISRDANWRSLRRTSTFDTITEYTTGSGGGTFTNDSKNITVTGATFLTDDIQIERRISLQGSTRRYKIAQVTGETTIVLDQVFDGTTISGTGTYSILAQAEYNLPIQSSHRVFLWHEEYSVPYLMRFITNQDLLKSSAFLNDQTIPTHYTMWGENWVIEQLKQPSVITISSSSSSDTNIQTTVFGNVSGFPDFEVITTNASNGTTSVVGSKTFQSVERYVSAASSLGRITATANSAGDTVAIIPVGDTTAGIQYAKVSLHPLPNRIFPMQVFYYKDPFRLVSNADIHELGYQFDEAIVLLATSKINYAQSKLTDGDKFFSMYRNEVRNLRKHNVDKIDWIPIMKPRVMNRGDFLVNPNLRVSQFGAEFGVRSFGGGF